MKRREPSTLFVFLIQPFLGFLLAVKNLRRTQNCIVFVLFSTLWGWSMSFEFTPADNYRIAAKFCQKPIYTFQQVLDTQEEGKSVDIYLNTVNFLIHQYTSNAKAYFAFLCTMFGIFCVASIRYVLVHRVNKNNQYLKLFAFLMFSTASLAYCAMPRFWTAAWIMTFATMNLMDKNYKWLPLLIILPYIHFSFLPISLIIFGAVFSSDFFMKHEKFLFFVLCITFLISFVLPESFLGYIIPDSMLEGESAQSKYNSYVNTNLPAGRQVVTHVSAYREANTWVTRMFQNIMKLAAFIVIISIRKYKNYYRNDERIQKMYTFILMLGSVCFFMSILRVVGWRFIWLLWLPLYYLFYVVYDIYKPRIIHKYGYLLIYVNIYTISHMFYVSYRTIDFSLFYMPIYNIIVGGFDFPPVYFV